MKKTKGISIIACGVFGKYGLELKEEGVEIFIHESSPDTLGLAVVTDISVPTKEENAKELYLYSDALEKKLNFSLGAYGGASLATICAHHPEEEMIVQEIEEQSKKYQDIKLPEKIIRQINKSWESGKAIKVYHPLENWAEEFVRNLSRTTSHDVWEPASRASLQRACANTSTICAQARHRESIDWWHVAIGYMPLSEWFLSTREFH